MMPLRIKRSHFVISSFYIIVLAFFRIVKLELLVFNFGIFIEGNLYIIANSSKYDSSFSNACHIWLSSTLPCFK